ncbi:MAG: HAD family hydrolase [Minisyncoccia bacterium]
MESFSFTPETKPNLTAEDIKDREDFLYLLSIMEKQGAVGVTQPLDYEDAAEYRDKVEVFKSQETLEGSVHILFDDIIFDFDGVLYDSTHAAYRALQLMLDKRGDRNIPFPSSIEEVANSYQAPFQNYYKRFGITFDTPEEIHSFRDAYREVQAKINEEHHTPSALYPEVKTILDKLKECKKVNPNLKIHIVSAGSEKQVRPVLEAGGILGDFDEIHLEAHDKVAAIKSIAERRTGERTVMVGDLPSDIKDARKVEGVKTIAIARGETEQERLGMYLPDYVVSDLTGLLNLESFSKKLKEKDS